MEHGKHVAAGVVAGYLLGRTRKMKLALTVGALVVGQKVDVMGMARRGAELLQSNADVRELTENVRGGLKDTGRAAATAAASRGVDSLSDKLQRRADRLRGNADEQRDETGDEAETADADEATEDDRDPPKDGQRRSGDGASKRSSKTAQRNSARDGSGAKKKSTSSKKTTSKKTTSSASSRGSTGSRQRRSATNG